jgi:hypothetical protein
VVLCWGLLEAGWRAGGWGVVYCTGLVLLPFYVYYIWAGRRYMWRVGPMRERPVVYLSCWVGRLLPFVEVSMCHAILSNGTICFCSPMLGFRVLYCYVILPKCLYMFSV